MRDSLCSSSSARSAPPREPGQELRAALRSRVLALALLIGAAGVVGLVQLWPQQVLLRGNPRKVDAREGLLRLAQRPPHVASPVACMREVQAYFCMHALGYPTGCGGLVGK
jgi:hypothetical protein